MKTFEFNDGNFNYYGNKIYSSANSKFAILGNIGNYPLRKEVYSETGSIYTFEDDSIITESGHTQNFYTFTNGTETKTFALRTCGKTKSKLDNSGFTLADGSSVAYDARNYSLNATTHGDANVDVVLCDDGINFVPDFSENTFDVKICRDGENIFATNLLNVEGTIIFNPFADEISLSKDTAVNLIFGGKNLEVKALDRVGGKLAITDSGIKLTFNEGDGALEFNVVETGRKVSVNITGAVIFENDGRISLEDGTVADLTWEDGNNLKLISRSSTGYLSFDADKGIGITSADENLDMTFTTAEGYTTSISSVQGTICYSEGKVIVGTNTKLTGKGSLGGQSINVTLEAIDGDR